MALTTLNANGSSGWMGREKRGEKRGERRERRVKREVSKERRDYIKKDTRRMKDNEIVLSELMVGGEERRK